MKNRMILPGSPIITWPLLWLVFKEKEYFKLRIVGFEDYFYL